ncbi:MAG: hypothetical protein KGJ23_02485 [Euryarchaeota archaeon]|nr:hypothetical protein [Euryarchaeota archaeon]MDE1835464.1 hypothetical protein [Euryarchaeota archaeon]MDE1881404.1 hypothetical protein [Euryarchaeota archaeon]MDE2045745.1 hypothetical protein [Thermoplasmata archaeon]
MTEAAKPAGDLGWFSRHAVQLKSVFRVVFGAIWGIDGALKFNPQVVSNFPTMVQNAAQGQPSWLAPWFNFWSSQASANAAFFVYLVGALELALAFALIAGFLRKSAYVGGCLLSLFIWAVPEGFGGAYGPSSTDIGTGVIYAMTFLMLLVINAAYGASAWSLDALIERRWPWWSKFAEAQGAYRKTATSPVAKTGSGEPTPSSSEVSEG